MYEKYYGLSEKPFNLTPDTDFYYQSLTHQQALNVLLVSLNNGDGFIKLTGEVGTGKTLLCRKLLDMLDDRFRTVYIPNPYMSCNALLKAVAEEMGLKDKIKEGNYLACINEQLINNARENVQTVILLDEAQSLPVESLDAIRLLSNLETEKQKLVQIILFGQPELDVTLENTSIRQLKQRIVHASELQNLSFYNLVRYVEHRLRSAGYYGPGIFSEKALQRLHKKSRGVPRIINLLCNKALMLAYAAGVFHVDAKTIDEAALDSQQVDAPGLIKMKMASQFAMLSLTGRSQSSCSS